MLFVTKKVKFSSAHRLFNPEYTNEQNDKIFDKCNNYHGHGHNYVLEVTVKGVPNIDTGYVIDLKYLKSILNDEIVEKVDHKHLNFDVPFLDGIIPTVENLSIVFWNILKDKIPNCSLHRIRIYETESSFVDYYGDDIELKNFKEL